MKWIIGFLIVVVSVAIYTGNMGGAKKAGENYAKVRQGTK